MMAVSVITCAGRDDIAARALDLVIDGLRAGIRARGSAHLALTGGSSAAALFVLPAGSICCVLASVIIVRIEFETWRTSVFGSVTTVVISVAGWSS